MHLVAIGGSDAGISAALRARELDPSVDVTVVVADAFPNFSICGIPYYISGEVGHWTNLAHRTHADLEATGMRLQLDTRATDIDVDGTRLLLRQPNGDTSWLPYDELVVGTGALPVRPPIEGLDELGVEDGVHLLHSMGDTFALEESLDRIKPSKALIVGAGYVGLEMAEGLTTRGIEVTQVEMLDEVLPTVDPELGHLVHDELVRHGVTVHTGARVTRIQRHDGPHRLRCSAPRPPEPSSGTSTSSWSSSASGPTPTYLVRAGAKTGERGAVVVDERMATGLPHVWAAGDCVITHHRLLGTTYLPLGTTAHKQGPGRRRERPRRRREPLPAASAPRSSRSSTSSPRVPDSASTKPSRPATPPRPRRAARTTTRPTTPAPSPSPSASPATPRPDASSARSWSGARGTETAKRVDTYATALFHGMTVDAMSELDLSYTPPLGSPWDAVQMAAQAWVRERGRR